MTGGRGTAWISRVGGPLRTRAALGLGPLTAPVMILVPAGALLGPAWTGLISVAALTHLDVVISVALATLGVFVGIATGTQKGPIQRAVMASTTEAVVTATVIAAATYLLLDAWRIPLGFPAAVVALTLGVAGSASAAPFITSGEDRAREVAARVADLDDILPIVGGAVILSVAASGGHLVTRDILIAIAAGAGAGVSGWLLIERSDVAERGVFVLGTLTMLGGLAGYLGVSPLLAGMAAGLFWALAPGHADRVAAADLRKVQHPLVVLLLLTAGASLRPDMAAVWLFAAYVLFRLSGKLLGGWFASRIAPEVAPSDLGAYLISPGVLGIAVALNLQQVEPEAAAPLLFAVSLGAVASEFLAVIVTPDSAAR